MIVACICRWYLLISYPESALFKSSNFGVSSLMNPNMEAMMDYRFLMRVAFCVFEFVEVVEVVVYVLLLILDPELHYVIVSLFGELLASRTK